MWSRVEKRTGAGVCGTASLVRILVMMCLCAPAACLVACVHDGGTDMDHGGQTGVETVSPHAEATDGTTGDAAMGDIEATCAYIDHIIDGDTVDVVLEDGSVARVRLIGVNTPESKSSDSSLNCQEGVEASEHLESMLEEGMAVWLECDVSDTDRYGRLLRYVWLEDPSTLRDMTLEDAFSSMCVNGQLARDGWAEPMAISPDTSRASLVRSLYASSTSPYSSGRSAREACE